MVADGVEAVFPAETRVPVGADEPRQHLPLRLVWPVRETFDLLPVPQPGIQHPGAEERTLHASAYRLNGARISPRNVFG